MSRGQAPGGRVQQQPVGLWDLADPGPALHFSCFLFMRNTSRSPARTPRCFLFLVMKVLPLWPSGCPRTGRGAQAPRGPAPGRTQSPGPGVSSGPTRPPGLHAQRGLRRGARAQPPPGAPGAPELAAAASRPRRPWALLPAATAVPIPGGPRPLRGHLSPWFPAPLVLYFRPLPAYSEVSVSSLTGDLSAAAISLPTTLLPP